MFREVPTKVFIYVHYSTSVLQIVFINTICKNTHNESYKYLLFYDYLRVQ